MNFFRQHILTLRLREDAPFPRDLREMLKAWRDKHSEKRSDSGRPDRRGDNNWASRGTNSSGAPTLTLVKK